MSLAITRAISWKSFAAPTLYTAHNRHNSSSSARSVMIFGFLSPSVISYHLPNKSSSTIDKWHGNVKFMIFATLIYLKITRGFYHHQNTRFFPHPRLHNAPDLSAMNQKLANLLTIFQKIRNGFHYISSAEKSPTISYYMYILVARSFSRLHIVTVSPTVAYIYI